MNSIPVLLLFIYSAFTINLLLQCGLGLKGAAESSPNSGEWSRAALAAEPLDFATLIKSVIIFFSVIILWFFFSRVFYSILPGIYLYILLFPVSSIFYDAMEYIVFRYVVKKENQKEKMINFFGGITAVAVFLCLNIAKSFLETAVLSLGFTSGILFIKLIIREIRKRAALEAVPLFLRGKPLVLITMGMLSLIFTTASLLLFRMIGVR